MSAHAKFSPSSAHRWIPCPGSIALCKDEPQTSSVFADEGTAAHTLAQRALDHDKPAHFFKGVEIQAGENVFSVDDEMIENVQVYLDYVQGLIGGDGLLFVEERVSFAEAVGVPDQFGTCDAAVLNGDGTHLTVIDLKYGRGVQVYAEDNEQMMTYAVAVLETFSSVLADVEQVTLVVVQPRLDHIDEWECDIARLRQHAENMRQAARQAGLALAAVEAQGVVPESFLQAGEKQCRFCPAKANCPELRRVVAETVYDDFQALEDPAKLTVAPEPAVPTGERLGATFGLLDLIETWCRAVRAETERMVMGGMTVVGPDGLPMKVIEGRKGHRAWRDEGEAEGLLTGILPPEKAYKPKQLISPSQADKLLKKAKTMAQWNMLEQIIVQPPGKPKIALGSNPAPPWSGEAPADEFETVEE